MFSLNVIVDELGAKTSPLTGFVVYVGVVVNECFHLPSRRKETRHFMGGGILTTPMERVFVERHMYSPSSMRTKLK